MDGYRFEVRCPNCGEELTHHADGQTTAATTGVEARCEPCGIRWHVSAAIRVAGPWHAQESAA